MKIRILRDVLGGDDSSLQLRLEITENTSEIDRLWIERMRQSVERSTARTQFDVINDNRPCLIGS